MSNRSSGSLAASPRQARLPLILRRLDRAYGPPAHARGGDLLDSLIATVLSQNTTDANSHRAFAQLKAAFPEWEQVLATRPGRVARAIRPGGLAGVKSRRIREILRRIQEHRGRLDLSFLRRMAPEQARDYLTALPGVGPKTAACVLLFALGKPAFPVDTHVLRVSKRLGLIPPATTMERAHQIYTALLGPAGGRNGGWSAKDMLTLHFGLVRHGRTICTARRPRCHACVLAEICPRVGVSEAQRPAGGTT